MNTFSIGALEVGYLIERLLIETYGGNKSENDKILEWNQFVQSKNIIDKAFENLKNSTDDMNLNLDDLIRQISCYALKNSSECLAETVSDVFTNKESAQFLSKLIYFELYNTLKE